MNVNLLREVLQKPAVPVGPSPYEEELRKAFRVAFARALEAWVVDLRAKGDNFRYILAGIRNQYNADNNLRLEWLQSEKQKNNESNPHRTTGGNPPVLKQTKRGRLDLVENRSPS